MRRRLARRLAALFRGAAGRLPERPVIVLGNQKSGTSAIASLLAEMGGLTKTIDIPPLWGSLGVAVMRGEKPLAEVVELHRGHFCAELIKEPMMTFFAGQVLEVFPEARLACVVRDPRDNIRSLLDRRQLPGDLPELDEAQRASLGNRITIDPEVWGGRDENYVGVLAHRWNLAAEGYLAHRERMRLALYEEFLADKLGFLERLAADLEIEPRADVRARLDVQYQPRGNREVSWQAFFGEENLARIERICASRLRELGYPETH
jgi:hypothetical protein